MTDEIQVLVSSIRPYAAPTPARTGTVGFNESGEIEQQSKTVDKMVEVVQANAGEFLDSWRKAFDAVKAVFTSNRTDEEGGFRLESITAKLSLSATGKVAFVGELGGDIAFEAPSRRFDG